MCVCVSCAATEALKSDRFHLMNTRLSFHFSFLLILIYSYVELESESLVFKCSI